jgi:MCP family monocarboxylic acid transporter-like MFS transporter 3
MQVFLTSFTSAFSGRAADVECARHNVFADTILLGFGTFMTSLTTKYSQIFLAQDICTGIGMEVIFMPAVAVMITYFARRKVMALTVPAAGSGTGSVNFPSIVQYLTPQTGM